MAHSPGRQRKGDADATAPIDLVRAALNELGARRRIMPVKREFDRIDDVAADVGLARSDAIQPLLLAVDRDFALALVPSGGRLSSTGVADVLGARRVHILGAQQTRAWLQRRYGWRVQPTTRTLAWWEVPFLSGLPTVVASEIALREMVVAPTGDPGWIVRLRSDELVRITSAHLGSILAATKYDAAPISASEHAIASAARQGL